MYDLKGSKKLLFSTEDRPFRGPGGFKVKDLTHKAKDFKNCPCGRPRGQEHPRGRHLCL